jgi:hypothetical protein
MAKFTTVKSPRGSTTVIREGSRPGNKYAKISNAIDSDINRKASAYVGEPLASTAKTKKVAGEIAADVVVDDLREEAIRDKYAKK